MDAGRFPVDVYPGWLRVTLSSVVPIGIAATVLAQVGHIGLRSYTGASA
jgi:ABC-type uncharacterized transport system permease subunit